MSAHELLSSDHFQVILHSDRKHALLFNRLDRTVTTIDYNDAKELSNLRSLGNTFGIVGTFLDRYLVLISNCSKVGSIYDPSTQKDHEIFVISQVQVIDISSKAAVNDDVSTKKADTVKGIEAGSQENESYRQEMDVFSTAEGDDYSSLPVTISTNNFASQSRVNWNPFKFANSLRPKTPAQVTRFTNAAPSENISGANPNLISDQKYVPEDSDRRLVEEMIKLFNNTNSFYFSPTLDLTKRFSILRNNTKNDDQALWNGADKRFFWNRHMLKDLIELSKANPDANCFINVILHGFIAIHSAPITDSQNFSQFRSATSSDIDSFDKQEARNSQAITLALVSRRLVYQAGTRYRRRGCDELGNCANFVETEQILRCDQHFMSFVQLRGSIPLFWYQRGLNYRPPPVLIKDEQENHTAFTKHFVDILKTYDAENIIVVDCTAHEGRERIIHDAFKKHIGMFNVIRPQLQLIEFDFHRHCRHHQTGDFQVEKHLESCGLDKSSLNDAKYYWSDGAMIWSQKNVFRVNCLDCSDRTNVVQRTIALQVLDLQLARIGMISPDICPEENDFRKIMQNFWSDNGNVLSTQYCGTRALFGGERKLSGYIKDTYSSASRYYISKFRDVYRQAAIDAMLGVDSIETSNVKASSSLKEQYELLNFDPLYASRAGGALIRDVGNRVGNRLARLKGRFNTKTSGRDSNSSASRQGVAFDVSQGIIETRLIETLDEMNIDWPSQESVNEHCETKQMSASASDENVFARYSNCDDNFQDDEFGQMMLSMDLAELQRLREVKEAHGSDEAMPMSVGRKEKCRDNDAR